MARPKKNKEEIIRTNVVKEEPKPRIYSPPPCSVCTNLRDPDTNYSEVYCTTRTPMAVYRYCKCRFCGNRFKDVKVSK